MADYSVWILGESQITVSGGVSLDGETQGDGTHLLNETIRLNAPAWQEVLISDANTDADFDDNDGNQTLNGAQTINGVGYGDGLQVEAEYLVYARDPATLEVYTLVAFNLREPGSSFPPFGTVEGLAFVGGVDEFPPIGVDLEVFEVSEGPGSGSITAIAAADLARPLGAGGPPCFTAGTHVSTPHGPRSVETLNTGDMVTVAGGGSARVQAILQRPVSAQAMRRRPEFRPVRISAGALGPGLPTRDLLVSRQHRMLVSSSIAERMFGERDVLVSAFRLTALDGVELAAPEPVVYVHLVLEGHDIVLAESTPTESFFPGRQAIRDLAPQSRQELSALFPAAVNGTAYPAPARPIPTPQKQRRLIERHLQNAKPLVTAG